MYDTDVRPGTKQFSIDKAKRSRAICKICKKKCLTGEIRIAKLIPDLLGVKRKKNWYHVDCIFKQFFKQRPATKRIQSSQDIDGWENITEVDQKMIKEKIEKSEEDIAKKYGLKKFKKKAKKKKENVLDQENIKLSDADSQNNSMVLFKEFYDVLNAIARAENESDKYAIAMKIVREERGVDLKKKIKLWCKFLFPGIDPRDYTLNNHQLSVIFARIFNINPNRMLDVLEHTGSVADTLIRYYAEAPNCKPLSTNTLTLEDVDAFMDKLCSSENDEVRIIHFENILKYCSALDLKTLIRLVKREISVNFTIEHVLEHVNPDAYQLYLDTECIDAVLDQYLPEQAPPSPMLPVLPMWTKPILSFADAKKKYPHGMFCELNFEGERIHVHKRDTEITYHSHGPTSYLVAKMSYFKNYISQAFPSVRDIILDCEIVLVSSHSGKLQSPRNLDSKKAESVTLGEVCLLVIDCLYYDGDISTKPLKDRRETLRQDVKEIPNVLVLNESKEVHQQSDMNEVINKMIRFNLETLILKDISGIYEPDQSHWLELHRDSFLDNNTGYTLDLAPLGAWGGVGTRVDVMSTFLMGCYDLDHHCYCTVTKVCIDPDNKFLQQMQDMKLTRIYCDASKIPAWMRCSKDMVPDYVAENPQAQPIWRVRGLEFCEDSVYTAKISLRYTQVLNLGEGEKKKFPMHLRTLKQLYESSKVEEEYYEPVAGTSKQLGEWLKRKTKSPDTATKKKKKEVEYMLEKISSGTVLHSYLMGVEPPPQYFEGIFLLLDDSVKRRHCTSVRSFMEHGGIVVPDYYKQRANYCLHLRDEEPEEKMYRGMNLRHIIIKWVEHTVEKGELQDVRPYIVRLASNKEPTDDLKQQPK